MTTPASDLAVTVARCSKLLDEIGPDKSALQIWTIVSGLVEDVPALLSAIEAKDRALMSCEVALNDWVHTYAPELCDASAVKATNERIAQDGTLGYIADRLKIARQAIGGSE